MNNKFSIIVIDSNSQFVEMVKKSLERTDNLEYAGCASDFEEVKMMFSKFTPAAVFINIDLLDSEAVKISEYLKTNFQDVFIIMMNIDEKQFGDSKPVSRIVDGYLEKNSLFQEVSKLSIYLKNNRKAKHFSDLPEELFRNN